MVLGLHLGLQRPQFVIFPAIFYTLWWLEGWRLGESEGGWGVLQGFEPRRIQILAGGRL